eukprot:CAMPEP_0114604838 /NCGR_PEP_ID=MMETSP0168-20121206/750_1 /TAXON_ID=95228 ORGANISM="Vannella sp., Strain DIVA3 517/6/12" /NCGR_SAMPLE_ID=MMETSP0168 /ASSEMBLY_ACC=CAM_ASM_000044 /LENGTH=980 /DNA_ID=CAMNT_0001815679 /DNA_START=110 /DNA_END=3048 /DNA_ORIENTATION=-
MAPPTTDARMRDSFLQLDATYEHLLIFRQHIKKITKLAKQYGQLAQEASSVSKQLAQCLAEVPVHSGCKPDESLALFGSAVSKLDNDRYAVARQLEPFFDGILKSYMPEDEIRAAGDLHRRISQTMNDYDAAHRRHAQDKGKQGGQVELQELETKFSSLYQMHKKKVMKSLVFGSFDVAERMSSFIFLMTNYVTQGFNSMLELEPTVSLLMSKLEQSRLAYEDINNPNRRSHNSIRGLPEDAGIEKQGYLFRKHKNGNWKLNWVVIRESSFLIYRKWKNFQPLLSLDLALAMVKPTVDVGAHKLEIVYKLEVITPNERVELRCLTEADHKAWLQVFENAIKFSLRDAKNDDATIANDIELLHQLPGNDKCADCGQDAPEWVSLNLGVLICLECSGVHRSLGTHVSKVRSLCLDRLPRSQLRILELIGNTTANEFWEAALDSNSGKIKPDTDRVIKTQFITAKYVEKVFTAPVTLTKDELADALFEAVQSTDVASISRYIQMGANVERVYYGKPLLHYAVMLGSTSCTEFLLQNDCMPNSEDENGFSALDQATLLNHKNCIDILQGRGGEHGSNSSSGHPVTRNGSSEGPPQLRAQMSFQDITPAEAKERHLSAASDMKEAVARLLNPLPAGPPKAKPNRLPPLPPLSARGQQPSVPAAITDKARYVKIERVIDKNAPISPPPQRMPRRQVSESAVGRSSIQQQEQTGTSPPPSSGMASPRSKTAALASIPSSTVGRATGADMDFGVSYASFKPPKPTRDPPNIPGGGHTSPRGMTSLDRLAALISPRGRGEREEKTVDVDTSKAKWTKPPIPDAIFKLLDSQDGSGDPPLPADENSSADSGISDAKWVKKSELPEDILRKLAAEPETQQRQLVEGALSPRQRSRSAAPAALSSSLPLSSSKAEAKTGAEPKQLPPLPAHAKPEAKAAPEPKQLPPLPPNAAEPPASVAVPQGDPSRASVVSGAAAAAKLRPRGQRPATAR